MSKEVTKEKKTRISTKQDRNDCHQFFWCDVWT